MNVQNLRRRHRPHALNPSKRVLNDLKQDPPVIICQKNTYLLLPDLAAIFHLNRTK